MIQMNSRKEIMKQVEMVFDFAYLLIILISAVVLYVTSEIWSLRWQYAIMSFILVIGDSFHLIPRMYSITDKKGKDYTVSLGIGKFITSITMTLFYIFLWEIGKAYYHFNVNTYIYIIVYGSALLRVQLCFFPQNGWRDKNPKMKWAIIRNIPFFILGMIVMTLYMIGAFKYGGSLSFLWIAILLSFAFYLPVVLFSRINPKVGMLMLPKSCAYIAIVMMGFLIT